MKISTSFKVVLLFAGTLVVIAAQWRTVSRLRYENRELQGAREQAAQTLGIAASGTEGTRFSQG